MTLKRILDAVVRRGSRSAHRIEFAPGGWATRLPGGATGQDYWAHFVARERAACATLIARARAGEPILGLDSDERHKHDAFGVVLTIAGDQKRALSILDVGGNLGDYYWLGRALAPNLDLDFHCRELPPIAEAGRQINPAVTFHTDDACFDRAYDLVMFSSSLQYFREWQDALGRAARACQYLFLSDVPTVSDVPSYVVTQHADGAANLHHQFNRSEVIAAAERAGLRMVREFAMGAHPPVANAPQQPTCAGWLFTRDATGSTSASR